jgi:hypothetical protein
MDFSQTKLTHSEWDSTEKPITDDERAILTMIIAGFENPAITVNTHTSFLTHFKLAYSPATEQYIFATYFKPIADKIAPQCVPVTDVAPKITGADRIRFAKIAQTAFTGGPASDLLPQVKKPVATAAKDRIYELVLLSQALELHAANAARDRAMYYYSLTHMVKYTVEHINQPTVAFIRALLATIHPDDLIPVILKNAAYVIEHNRDLLKYADLSLYSHQKRIFEIFGAKANPAKLVLYMAPTGTGKTMTPLALAQKYRVIFMCAARHVGLALARSAISVGRKIAFAFGCQDAGDVRLHYAAAATYTTNTRSGGIHRVDNSDGRKVEIIICDVASYIPAMNYMIAHNQAANIITYWDEPTISLDVAEHAMHGLIQRNWSKNKIPNVVLSSATLPTARELRPLIDDFCRKFEGAKLETIHSFDCKKSIPLVNSTGYIVMPHYLCGTDKDLLARIGQHCEANPTLLRYLDLQAVTNFIDYVNSAGACDPDLLLENTDYFETVDAITITAVKMYYLKLVQHLIAEKWSALCEHFCKTREYYYGAGGAAPGAAIARGNSTPMPPRGTGDHKGVPLLRTQSVGAVIPGPSPTDVGMLITTKDAHTLTDGPTIFIANDVRKIAQFCIQKAEIPDAIMSGLYEIIAKNNEITAQIAELQKSAVVATDKGSANKGSSAAAGAQLNKANRTFTLEETDTAKTTSHSRLMNTINEMRGRIKAAQLNEVLVPNKTAHIQKWASGASAADANIAFTSNIDPAIVTKILGIDGLDDYWKILLMMGIGVFMKTDNASYDTTYMEIMKELAADQKLYLIIASSDYIYGTNYQLCHGYLSKDLTATMTQEKIIQALGRIGRNNIQQKYSARFRDDGLFIRLFTPDNNKPEVANMCRLFSTNAEDFADVCGCAAVDAMAE